MPRSAPRRSAGAERSQGDVHWLADQPGFKKRITHSAAEYFNADNRTMALANYSRPVSFPSLPQVEHVLRTMPFAKPIDKRNRAIVAFFLLTAARVGAVISARMGHVDIVEQLFFQDARDVHTKNSKTIETWFVPVRSLALEIFRDYHRFRVEEQLAGPADPLFPSTRLERVPGIGFQATGLAAEHWTTAGPVREILRTAFQNAGLRYYHPHTFRHLLSSLAKQHCTSLQDFQAWGQNICHKNLVTTMEAYGPVSREEQRDLIRRARRPAQ